MALFQLTCEDRGLLTFLPSPDDVTISARECHVWLINTSKNTLSINQLLAILGPKETTQANRFVFAEDRERYIIAHGFLRIILGKYTGLAPTAIRLGRTITHKPILLPGQGDYHFNLSHSADQAAVAVSKQEMGIDLEQIRADIDWAGIANHYFSPQEVSQLQQADVQSAVALFYKFWTCKEAFLKATGLGLIDELNQIDTSAPFSQFGLNDDRLTNNISSRWHILSGITNDQYVMSLAYPPELASLRFFQADALFT